MTKRNYKLINGRKALLSVLAIGMSGICWAQSSWKGFARVNVKIDGRDAYYVKPKAALPGKPWVWRASFPDWHTEMDSLLLERGFHVAFINVDDMYGSPSAMLYWDKYYQYLTDSVKLSLRPALEAVSRGGLYALGWAKRNPDKVSCIYSETPVYDFKAWPGGKGKGPGDTAAWKQLLKVYGFTDKQALEYKDNPVDNLEGLASFKVPILNMIGPEDKLAIPAENSLLFTERYVAAGGPVTTFPVTEGPQEMSGHHVPVKHAKEWADFMYYNSYPVKSVLPYYDYYKKRAGLHNFYNAAQNNKKATVAFLGGSITFNPGWRDKVTQYLRERFPETQFHFIKAGIPSLGSNAHAFRLQRDVLDSGKVDLLFIEAAVNDRVNGVDSITQVRGLEGIVRQARNANPYMDIVMMEFADPDKTADYKAGKVPVEISNHELVANSYNVASINIAGEVKEKIANGELDWNDDFRDIHPAPYGQELYFANIKALLTDCFDDAKGNPVKYKLPKPLNSASFDHGQYYDIHNAKFDSNWRIDESWKPSDGLDTRPGYVNVPMLVSDTPGAALKISFKGNAIGIAIASGSDAGIITYSIDGGPEQRKDLFTQWSSWLHLPWYLMLGSNLKDGSHTLEIKISDQKNDKSKGHACRIVYFLLNK